MTDAPPPPPKTAYFSYTGYIGPDQATRIASVLNGVANQGSEELYLCLNSPGGMTGDGMFLYNLARALPLRLTMHNIGNVSSAAATFFMAADRRLCSQHSMFLIHPITLGPYSEPLRWEQLDGALRSALAEEQRVDDVLRERTSLPPEMLGQRRVRDVHIDANAAKLYGFVHEVSEFALPQGEKIFQI